MRRKRENYSIYAVGANPALDLSGHVRRIVPNEKNYVQSARVDPGGNAVNVARIAKRLGAKPILLGFLGGGSGEQLKTLLDEEGIAHRFVPIQAMTRINVTVTNDEDHLQTRLMFPGPKPSAAEIRGLLQIVGGLRTPGIVVVGGSLPSGVPRGFYLSLIRAAQRRGLGVMVDVPVPYLENILSARIGRLLLIKPNQKEFEALIGRALTTVFEIAREAHRLLSKVEVVCISLGERGAVLAWNGLAWHLTSPRVRARGSVGAGDSMVGAVATRLARKGVTRPELCRALGEKGMIDAIRWGAAAGAAAVTAEGTSLGSGALVRRLFPRSSARRIL